MTDVHCLKQCLFIWILNLLSVVKADVVCNAGYGFPLKYCYGVTAYCCGSHYQDCCWQEIWKVWWFWVVAFVVITAIFSCCGYYCSGSSSGGGSDGYGGFLRRESSFSVFRRFRRYSSRESYDENVWKPYTPVALPPYSPATTSTVPPASSVDPNPPQNLPYLEPPPPYTTVISRPQPAAANETTNLLPSAPADAHQTPTAPPVTNASH